MASTQSLYDCDFYAWANEQAALLRDGKFAEADIPNIAEEIESIARREKRELVNCLTRLLVYLLKWQCQPLYRSDSWRLSIKQQRLRLASHLKDNPSLGQHLDEVLQEAFELAVVEAQIELGFEADVFSERGEWAIDDILRQDWVPE
jgi:hypothetical protein